MSSEWRIRPAQVGDAASIARVSVDTWRAAYHGIVPAAYLAGLNYERSTTNWTQTIADVSARSTCVLVAEHDGTVVGFAVGGPSRNPEGGYAGELYALYVRPEVQGGGVGRALVAAVAMHLVGIGAESMHCWALTDGPANGFYERLGGVVISTQPFELNGHTLQETGYGWRDVRTLAAKQHSKPANQTR